MKITISSRIVLAISILVTGPLARADLKLGSTFSDNMVLQRNQDVTVWGEADPGQVVHIQLGKEKTSATADRAGHWESSLHSLPVGGPYTATISSGNDSIELKNILSGDVWLCAGQSNMQLGVDEDIEAEQMKSEARSLPTLRLLSIPKLGADRPTYRVDARWVTADSDVLDHFSAVAVHFALGLSRDPKLAKVPIGLIDSSFGGTSAEGWTPALALPQMSREDLSPSMFNLPRGGLYNNMIAPLGPLSLSGVVWYQGENNSGKSQFYPAIMHRLIAAWRRQFHSPHLPFIIVQLPPFIDLYAGFPFTWLRDAQSRVVRENQDTGLVVSIDTTSGFNLHPREKGAIGRRAALQARRLAYHEPIVADGPTLESAVREHGGMRLTFDTHDGPLFVRGDSRQVFGFALAGADGVFHFADAQLAGERTIIVRCDEVPDPRFVRYAFSAVPVCNLYNSAGLPAGPFRTDDFPPTVPIEIKPVVPSRRVATELYDVTITGNGDLASLGVDKQQFISNELDGAGVANFPNFFGSRQLQNAVEKTSDSISFSDLGVCETYSFFRASMTLQIQNLSKDPNDQVLFRLRTARGLELATQGSTFDLTRGHSHVRISGAESATREADGGYDIELKISGGTRRTIVFTFSKSA